MATPTPTDPNLNDSGPLAEFRLRKPPFWMISLGLIAATATLVPLAAIARARFNTSPEPRIHIFQDMGNQPRTGPQKPSKVFADGRWDRPIIEGTVARTAVIDDPHFTAGYTRDPEGNVKFLAGYPTRITVDRKVLERGRERYNIYCASCHGLDGLGNGMVNVRANAVSNGPSDVNWGTSWVQPANLHDQQRRDRPEGHLFNTITNGIRNMAGLGHQIPPEDRWAIVAYVRALQLSDTAPATVLPPETRQNLK